jgi:hypothetical protein
MPPPTANIGPSAGIRKSCLLNYPGPADTVLAHHGQWAAVVHQHLAQNLCDTPPRGIHFVQLRHDPRIPARVHTTASHLAYGGCSASAAAGAGGIRRFLQRTHQIHAVHPHPYSTRHSALTAGVGAGTLPPAWVQGI